MVENGTENDDHGVKPLRPIKGGDAGPAWAAPAMGGVTGPSQSARESEQESASGAPAEDDSLPVWTQGFPPQPPEPPSELPASTGAGSSSRRTAVAVGVIGLALVAVIGTISAFLLAGDQDEPEPPLAEVVAAMSAADGEPPASASDGSSTAADEAAACKDSTSADLVTGDGAGDRDSGPGVILAFEHAYYNERDAEKMIALTSKDSPIRDVDALQEGIDSNPRDLTHCVRVAATDEDDEWLVEITQTATGSEPETITQRITTTKEDGQWSVVKIEQASR